MGSGASSQKDESLLQIHYPKESIAEISRQSKLSFVAVLREWQRWIELGCDDEGILSVERLRAEYDSDVIMYRVIDSIPTTADGKISFTDFCRYLYIWQTMTMEERLQTLFQILNNGDPLTAETVTEVIRAVRPESEDLDQIRMIAAQMPASLSCLGTSVIDEEDFVAWAKNLPLSELGMKLGNFTIIDQRVMAAMEEQANRQQQ
ncbi:hypothetical protein ACHWQZ_G002743 [Mnemiopsis leidyi]